MARTRLISPSFFKHYSLWLLEHMTGLPVRVAYAGLWTVADRRGVFRWTGDLKPDVIPYDACDVLVVLDALASAGFVVRFVVEGKEYGYIPSFTSHQTFHHAEKPGKNLPDPPSDTETSPRQALGTPEAKPTVAVAGTVAASVSGTGTTPTTTATTPLSTERPSKGARGRKRVDEQSAPKENWPAAVADRWCAQVGMIREGRVGKDLKPAFQRFGLPILIRAVDSFAHHRRLAMAGGNEKPDNWPQFVRDFTDYVPKNVLAAALPRTDEVEHGAASPAWVDKAVTRWAGVIGLEKRDRLETELAPAVAIYGEEAVLAAITKFGEWRRGRLHEFDKHVPGLPYFVANIRSHIPRNLLSQEPQAQPDREPWLATIGAEWEKRYDAGSFDYRTASGVLQPLVDAGHTPDEIARRLKWYLDNRGSESTLGPDERRRRQFTPSLRDFRLRFGQFDPSGLEAA